ncbi:MAG TPA: hypothetical protein VF815_22300 [Myxococcaceae bacterium]
MTPTSISQEEHIKAMLIVHTRPSLLAAIASLFLMSCNAGPIDGAEDLELAEIQSALDESGSVLYSGDRYQHYYSTNGGRCVFQTSLGTLGDSVLWLYGPNSASTLISYNDDHGGTLASRIEAYLSPGVYYPTVGGYGSATGTYNISMNCYSAVHYRAHTEKYGWHSWGYDGFLAGTEYQGLRMEAVQIQLANMPGVSVRYTVHVAGVGWMGEFYDGQVGGTTGQSRRMEGIKIWLVNAPPTCGIRYQAHVQGWGWMSAVSDGALAGTEYQGRRMEGLRIWLTGECG